jgi:hypothetical protein
MSQAKSICNLTKEVSHWNLKEWMEILEWLSMFIICCKVTGERDWGLRISNSLHLHSIYLLRLLTHHMGTFCKCRIEKDTPTKSFELKLVSSWSKALRSLYFSVWPSDNKFVDVLTETCHKNFKLCLNTEVTLGQEVIHCFSNREFLSDLGANKI